MFESLKDKIFGSINKDRLDLRKVNINIGDDTFTLYFRPFTAIMQRDCLANATVTKQVRDEGNNVITEYKHIDQNLYATYIIYYQSLDENGNRVFTNFTDADLLYQKLEYTTLAMLASVMGANIDKAIERVANGK